jgi:hypothetical protein
MQRSVWTAAACGALLLACSSSATTPGDSGSQAAAGSPPADLEPSEPYEVVTVTLVAPDGTAIPLRVFDANTPDLRRFGLMERTELPPRAGMVFRYSEDSDGGYWMRNTLIPLSIAYFDAEGVVHTVLDMEPCDADPCPSYPPDAPYRGALEVNQGFFAELGLEPSWRVELPGGLPPPQP